MHGALCSLFQELIVKLLSCHSIDGLRGALSSTCVQPLSLSASDVRLLVDSLGAPSFSVSSDLISYKHAFHQGEQQIARHHFALRASKKRVLQAAADLKAIEADIQQVLQRRRELCINAINSEIEWRAVEAASKVIEQERSRSGHIKAQLRVQAKRLRRKAAKELRRTLKKQKHTLTQQLLGGSHRILSEDSEESSSEEETEEDRLFIAPEDEEEEEKEQARSAI